MPLPQVIHAGSQSPWRKSNSLHSLPTPSGLDPYTHHNPVPFLNRTLLYPSFSPSIPSSPFPSLLTLFPQQETLRTLFKNTILYLAFNPPIPCPSPGDPCPQPEPLKEEDLEPCTPHHGYDYFEGSEISYIVSWTILGLVPFSEYSGFNYRYKTDRERERM